MIPRCKPNGYPEYCGDTCNCGYMEYRRGIAYEAMSGQVDAINRRWAKTLAFNPTSASQTEARNPSQNSSP